VCECMCGQRRQHRPRRQVFSRSSCAVPTCTSTSLRWNVQRRTDVACPRSRRVVDRAWSTRWSTHREVIVHILVKQHNPVFYTIPPSSTNAALMMIRVSISVSTIESLAYYPASVVGNGKSSTMPTARRM
jgi:hypothetical protein